MQLLLSILKKYSLFITFIFLELLSLFVLLNFKRYANSLAGGFITYLNGSVNTINGDFFKFISLGRENEKLTKENIKLLKKIDFYKTSIKRFNPIDSSLTNPIKYKQEYTYIAAEVIKNSITNSKNYIILDKGIRDGISQDMGVITNNGIVGIINNTSNKYASVISLLNTKTKVNARIKNNGIYGSIIWDGKDPRYVSLIDIPRYQTIKKGDTIETDGKSSVFPEGIPIGKIYNIFKNEESSDFILQIKLFEDFNKLGNVYIVNNLNKIEIDSLQIPEEIKNVSK